MQGLAGLLGYETPFTDFVGDRRNTLMGLAGGMMGHRGSFTSGLGKGLQYAQQGRQVDLAENQMQMEERARRQEIAQAQEQKNATLAYLQKNRPDLFEKVQAGMPVGEAWKILNTPAEGEGTPKHYGTAIWGTDASGNPVIGQLTDAGGINPVEMPEGMSFGKEPIRIDAGDRHILLDPVTRQPISEIPKQGGIPTGYRQTPEGMEAVPGSPDAREQAFEQRARDTAARQADERAEFVIKHIDDAIEQSNWLTTGQFGSAGRAMGIPGHVELQSTIDPIIANLGFTELQQMREASPTGGALGQVTERELAMLQSTVTSLNLGQGEGRIDENLNLIKNLLRRNQVYREIGRLGIDVNSQEAQAMLAQYPLPGQGKDGQGQSSTGVQWSIE